jgi:shikimate kinase
MPGVTIFLVGASGSGKTVIARKVAQKNNWQLFDTDAEILRAVGAQRIADIWAERGEPYFRQLERETIERLPEPDDCQIVATGGGLPAVPEMMDRLNNLGVTIYLKATLDALWNRLSVDPRELEDRPLLQEDGKNTLGRLLRARQPLYNQSAITLDTDKLSITEVCNLVVAEITSVLAGINGDRSEAW